MNSPRSLGGSARESLLWGGGFTLLRDVVQFVTMLVLVRLLTPEEYGSVALAQSILGLVSVVSFGTLVMHALQLRNPSEVDWQAHFSAAAVINTALFMVTLGIAWLLSFSERYHSAALPLAGLATVLLIEIAGTLRHRMLETRHDWRRFRLLLIIGTLLGSATGLIVALAGGGVWALVVQVPLFGLPAAIDLFWHGRWRPQWTWSWARYRDTAHFGMNRMGTAAVLRGRHTIEQTVLAGVYDFAALGVFSRALGLATLIAGRIGSVAMMSLYPVVTRAEQRTERFQRIAGLVLRGVCWATVPAAIFLALCAENTVALLYGPRWDAVVSLLPFAVAGVALAGMASAASSLLLANNEVRTCLLIDLASAVIGVGLALWFIPFGIEIYLAALAGHGLFILLVTLVALVMTHGIDRKAILTAFAPAALAGAAAALAVAALRLAHAGEGHLVLRFVAEAAVFGLVYVAILRAAFPGAVRELLGVAPGGQRIQTWLHLS